MKSGKHNIEIESGSQFDMVLTITNADGTDYSLTGYTPDMQIRSYTDRLIVDCASYVSVQNGNEINVSIPASATASVAEEDARYQIEIVNGTTEYSVMRGDVTFTKAVIQ